MLRTPALVTDARFSTNARRSAARTALDALILECFGRLTAAEVLERLERAGIANASINDMAQLWAHPQLVARNRWRKIATPAGEVPALLPPALPSGVEPRMDPVPALGEHTERILGELGYDGAAISQLREAGAL